MATDIAIKLLARELNISVDRLIYQFSDIGICKTDLDYVSLQEKKFLFMHMNRDQKKVGINKLTLQRKTLSTLNVFSSGGKSKKIQVEVRKKHTYVQCDSSVSQNRAVGNILGFVNESDVFSNVVPIKEDASDLTCEESLKSDLSIMSLRQDDNDVEALSYQEGDRVVILDNKNMLEKEDMSKNLGCSQYESKEKKTSYLSKQKKNSNIISDVSSVTFNKNSSSKLGHNKKKVDGDRRFRIRQRLHSVKSQYADKANVKIKYKKNNSFNAMKYEYDEFPDIVRGIKNKQRKTSILTHAFNKPNQVVTRDVVIGEIITVSELANKMAVKGSHVIKMIMQLGAMVTINQVIDQQTAQLVAEEMGHRVILRRENDLEEMVMNDREFIDTSIVSHEVEYRAPVVTIMGHVDHGKTSLLDYIRSSKVVDSEEGGITQHIGAYCVKVPYTDDPNNGRRMITFLDTPGHEAFTAMRSRGVQITDIVVLVVAVDDGVMLQTIEAIQHVKTSKIPMIVALNKIDKLGSFDINRIKNDLAKEGVISEEWGGGTQFVNVSAKSGIGVDNLLNAILLESELLELKTIRKAMATGVVIESFLDRGRGPVANVLVREGTLRCGDVVLCGLEYGRIRSMRNELGDSVNYAGPSVPVEVFGLSGPPFAGDFMVVVRDERKAREVALYRQGKFRSVKLARIKKNTLENVLSIGNKDNIKLLNFNIVLKADLQGSVEAISDVLKALSSSDIKVNILGSGVGRINETDVSLAITTRSVLLGFNVQADILARKMIELEDLDVYYYSVIYDLIDGVKRLIDGMLIVNNQKRKSIALAEVRDVFCLPKLGNIAGCMILEGVVRRYNKVRILREKNVLYEGELASLRRFKDDVNEVRAGMECGISIKNYTDFCSGDFIEVFD